MIILAVHRPSGILGRLNGEFGDDGDPFAGGTIITAYISAVSVTVLGIRGANLRPRSRRQDDPLVASPRLVVRHAQRVRILLAFLVEVTGFSRPM